MMTYTAHKSLLATPPANGEAYVRAYFADRASLKVLTLMLRSLVRRITDDLGAEGRGRLAGEPEDYVQATLVQCLDNAAKYDASRGSIKGWAATMLRNIVIDSRKRHSNWREVKLLDAPHSPDSDDSMLDMTPAINSADGDTLHLALAVLAPADRAFLSDVLEMGAIGAAGKVHGMAPMKATRTYKKIILKVTKALESD